MAAMEGDRVAELGAELRACMARFKSREDHVSRDENGVEKGRVRFFDLRGVTEDKFDDKEKANMAEAMRVLRERKQKGQQLPKVIKITPQNMEAFLRQSRAKYNVVENMPTQTLNNGKRIPLIGLGTWKSKAGEIKQATLHALRAGYRHIDCAEYYANEHEIGQALQIVFAEGVVKREDVFLTSKLWNNHHGRESVKPAVQKILRDLKVNHLDLLLIHWPVTGNVGPTVQPSIRETWQAMEDLVSEGLVHSIGVSNFSTKKVDDILAYAKVKPAVLQVEVHPYWRQDSLLTYCQEKGIHVTAYSPLGSPDSSTMFQRKGPKLMDDPVLASVASKLNKSPAQCLIRWGIQHGTSILPKSVNEGRIKSNLDVIDWELPREDYESLCGLVTQERMVNGSFWLNPSGPYKTLEDLWDVPHDAEAFLRQSRAKYNVVENMPTQTLNNGKRIPLIGLGTWKSKAGEIKQATLHALRAGYRHIDCAEYYANEHEIGQALQIVFAEGVVKREDVFLTSKLWNNHHGRESVKPAVQKILRDLKVNHLDLLLIHWPVTGNVGPTVQPSIRETWQAMEDLVSEGLVHSIGVSNFSTKKVDDILAYAKVKPAVLQVEVHPYWRQDSLLTYCQEKGIHVTAYSPLGSPDSSTMFQRKGPKLMDDPVLASVASKLNKSPAQCLIRWGIQHGTSILPKSVNEGRIKSNLDVIDWELPREDYESLCGLVTQERMVSAKFWIHPSGPYKTQKDFWDE
ncbi:NADP-dependent oxidoreductase [Chloropicon primus]|nr:NADP-dependent oxidoreductase [Chloropicon primus]